MVANNLLPFINVRDVVVFPNSQLSLVIGRKFTIEAIEYAKKNCNGKIVVISQKAAEKNDPSKKSDMFSIGTICKIRQSVKFPDGTMKVKFEGVSKVSIEKIVEVDDVRQVNFTKLTAKKSSKITPFERQEVIDLLVRWNPLIATDPKSTAIKTLQKSQSDDKFLDEISRLIVYSAEIRESWKKRVTSTSKTKKFPVAKKELEKINLAVKKRQKILEEQSRKKKLELIRSVLRDETIAWLIGFKVVGG